MCINIEQLRNCLGNSNSGWLAISTLTVLFVMLGWLLRKM